MTPIRLLIAVTVLAFGVVSPCGQWSDLAPHSEAVADLSDGLARIADATGAGAALATVNEVSQAVREVVRSSALPAYWTVAGLMESLRGTGHSADRDEQPLELAGYRTRRPLLDLSVTEKDLPAEQPVATPDAIRALNLLPPRVAAYSYQTRSWVNQRVGLQAALGVPADDDQLLVGLGVDFRF